MNDMHDIEMNQETFWNLIAQAKEKCGEDLEASADWIREQLLFIGAEQALSFHNIVHAYRDHAMQFGVWSGANVLSGGLSDDSFMDFCAWLIAQGKETYAAVLADPDALADVKPYGDCRFESLAYIGDRACEELTGRSAYDQFDKAGYRKLMAEVAAEVPLGEGINYPYSTEEAVEYLPKLCAKYDVNATGTWNYDCVDVRNALKKEKKSSRVRNRGDAR